MTQFPAGSPAQREPPTHKEGQGESTEASKATRRRQRATRRRQREEREKGPKQQVVRRKIWGSAAARPTLTVTLTPGLVYWGPQVRDHMPIVSVNPEAR